MITTAVKPLRLVLADDQVEVRRELRALLEASANVTVVGEAGDGLQLLALLDRIHCDAVLLDLTMPRMSGLEVLRAMALRPDHPPIVALSIHDDAAHVDRALSLGASGYLLKSARPREIMDAIEAAVSGGAYVQPSLAQPMLRRHWVLSTNNPAPVAGVSPRQRELLRALAIGLGNKAIAHRLGIGEETVKGYLKDLYPRIGVSNRSAAVAWALRHRLID